ncbi:MAG: c-type cytochrome [bacterium]
MPRINLEALDRRFKWWLLILSLLTLGFLGAAALRENVFAQWRMVRLDYGKRLEAKATDERGRALARQYEVRIVQNVLPELGTVDRCVTCHAGADDPRMAKEPQPFRTHPGQYLVDHPPEKFGCTICHRGQGRALEFEEAKAVGHHWDYPLLPTPLTQSACGLCHTAEEVADKGGEKYALGKRLFDAKGCQACHKLDGRGGSVGAALDVEGLKVRGQIMMTHLTGDKTLPNWLTQHFDDPQKIVPGSLMRPPQLSREENEALTIYMLSLQNRDLPKSYLSPAKHLEYFKKARPDAMTGEQLFNRYCSTCHDTGQYGRYDPFFHKFIPAVRGATFVQTASKTYVEENIRRGRPGTLMAGWGPDVGGLTNEEVSNLASFLLGAPLSREDALTSAAIEQARGPLPPSLRGNASRGRAIFSRNCAACHGPGGVGLLAPALANPVLQQTASDGFLFATIAYGHRNTAMPAFLGPGGGGFNEHDIADVVAYLRTLGGRTNPSAAHKALSTAEVTATQKETSQ